MSSDGRTNVRKSRNKKSSDEYLKKSSNEYLADQIADARLALGSTLDDLTLDVARAADLRRWVRRYPWAAVGTAAVAGFTLAYILTPKRRETTARSVEGEPVEGEPLEV